MDLTQTPDLDSRVIIEHGTSTIEITDNDDDGISPPCFLHSSILLLPLSMMIFSWLKEPFTSLSVSVSLSLLSYKSQNPG